MTAHKRVALHLLFALLYLQAAGAAFAQASQVDGQRVATWSSAQQERRVFGRGEGQAQDNGSLENQTVHMIVRTSIGGRQVRVWLSNLYGMTPLRVGAARIALRGEGSEIIAGSDRRLMFSGMPSVTIPPGAPMVSDPVDIYVPPLANVAVSLYIPEESGAPMTHALALHTTFISTEGDFTSDSAIPNPTTTSSWYWLSSIDVLAPENARTIVAFGDSITDGLTATLDANRSWPSVLAERLNANTATANIGVVNMGISGNRVLGDGAGVSALARFDRDVLSQPGVRWVMIMEGINDIGGTARGNAPGVSAETLIAAMRQMITRAHGRGIKVVGCTLTPYEGAGYFSESGETMRQALNRFIRTSGEFDAVVDFDAVIRDPDNPRRFLPHYTNGDNLHPNDDGYRAMAEAVDLSIFLK